MENNFLKKLLIVSVPVLLLAVGAFVFLVKNEKSSLPVPFETKIKSESKTEMSTFKSEQDFKDYLSKVPADSFGGNVGGTGMVTNGLDSVSMKTESFSDSPRGSVGLKSAQRVSGTNVQVSGIDEPDIVKTDGKEIFLSREEFFVPFRGEPMIFDEVNMKPQNYPEYKRETNIIKSFPPSELASKKITSIDKNGNLLLSDGILVIFSGQDIFGYNVSDSKNPKEIWKATLKDNTYLESARLHKDKIYIVAKSSINIINPCPIEPMTAGGVSVSIACDQIYRPISPTATDVTFNVMKVDIGSGQVENASSFVGSSENSTVYVSSEAMYIANVFRANMVGFMFDFLKENPNLFPEEIVKKIGKLDEYDISDSAKIMELGMIVERYYSSLEKDERLRLENELENKMKDYSSKHVREIEKTGIAKIDLKNLEVVANGEVPGHALNQFSIDEFEGNLRIATTVGGGWMGFGGSSESLNDVYVLNSKMENIGNVQNLGKGERIYSARFIGEKGYLVTFKQIDPFFVLDLSDPKNPAVKGELKIPGYSSYLHPIKEDIILGIGKEDGQTKLSLFDVSSAENPKEISKYNLDEYWSEAENNHHAFLQDEKHQVFFIPGSKGGYVFSYKDNNLSLVKAISDYNIKRAIYINDFLYVIGDNKIIAFDENTWEKAGEIDLK